MPKALILSAGLGTRLKPLTNHIAKPLVPFFGIELIYLHIHRLLAARVADIAINTHHLSSQVETCGQNNPWQNKIKISHEKNILGSGGAFLPLKTWFGKDTIIAVNGDIVSDIDIEAVINFHKTTSAQATLVLLPKALRGFSPVVCDKDKIISIAEDIADFDPRIHSKHTFASIHIFSAHFLDYLPHDNKPCSIWLAYRQAMANHEKVNFFIHHGFWHAIDDISSYWLAHTDLFQRFADYQDTILQDLGINEILNLQNKTLYVCQNGKQFIQGHQFVGPLFICGNNQLKGEMLIGPQVGIFGDTVIEKTQSIENCIILPGSRISNENKINGYIVGSNFRIAVHQPATADVYLA